MYLSTMLAQKKTGGGVSVFLKNSLYCRITEINNVSSESIEFVHIKLQAP